jgi:hypothetical protein
MISSSPHSLINLGEPYGPATATKSSRSVGCDVGKLPASSCEREHLDMNALR